MEKAEYIWQSGEFVPWDEARVHVLSHGLHYGTGVFEGIRCYDGEQGPAIFRHADHLRRLEESARMYCLELPYSVDEIGEATRELIRRNGLRDCYIRPLAFRGYGEMGLFAKSAPVEVIIAVWPWGAYLGDDGKKHGIRAKVSSWRRISPASSIPHAKASGQYLNSILAKTESANAGYEEAILLDERGFVCEGSGENIFVVKDGRVSTPPQVAAILDGITRKSVMQTAGSNWSSAISPALSCTPQTRSSSAAPRLKWSRCGRSTTTRSASPVRSQSWHRAASKKRSTAGPPSIRNGSTWSVNRAP